MSELNNAHEKQPIACLRLTDMYLVPLLDFCEFTRTVNRLSSEIDNTLAHLAALREQIISLSHSQTIRKSRRNKLARNTWVKFEICRQ